MTKVCANVHVCLLTYEYFSHANGFLMLMCKLQSTRCRCIRFVTLVQAEALGITTQQCATFFEVHFTH